MPLWARNVGETFSLGDVAIKQRSAFFHAGNGSSIKREKNKAGSRHPGCWAQWCWSYKSGPAAGWSRPPSSASPWGYTQTVPTITLHLPARYWLPYSFSFSTIQPGVLAIHEEPHGNGPQWSRGASRILQEGEGFLCATRKRKKKKRQPWVGIGDTGYQTWLHHEPNLSGPQLPCL